MPITYEVKQGGHQILAVASGVVSSAEFIQYELDHAIDARVKSPVSELLVIEYGALSSITETEMALVLERRKSAHRPPTPHRLAVVVAPGDLHAWDLAKFYRGMVQLHAPATVIVFGDLRTAKVWLGVKP